MPNEQTAKDATSFRARLGHSDFFIRHLLLLMFNVLSVSPRANPRLQLVSVGAYAASALDEAMLASKFSALLANETLPAVCNRDWCRIGRVWERCDALSRKASAAYAHCREPEHRRKKRHLGAHPR